MVLNFQLGKTIKSCGHQILLFQDRSNFESGQDSLCGSDQGSIKTQIFICQQDKKNKNKSDQCKESERKNSQKQTKMLINLNR